jgi:hypothetical protein
MPLGSSSPENTTRNGRAQVPGRVDAELIEAGLAGPTRRQDRA